MPNFDIKKHLFEIEQLNKYKAIPDENKTVPEDDGTKSSTIKQRINPEQLKNIVLYNDGNKEHPKTQREELTKNIIESNVQKNEDSALEILAQQNRSVLTTKGNFGNMRNTYGSEHFTIFGENITAESKYAERANHNSSTGENEGTTVTSGGNENNGNGTETITDNWEGKQKYTHEYIKSLNIGISVETFQQILSDFFENPRIIDGKLTYVLKSGTISQVTDLIAQIYVAERLSSTPDYIPDPPEEDKGYALLDKDTYNDRRANYYYMCYMNGIPFDGHEFENGTYDRDIARACGLYEYENVFENYMMDENVQKYLQENFGITISLPPSEEYADLWNKLANLAAMDETGNNTNEYNKQNVLKYFGLALTDSAFMEFVDKASYVQQEENPVRNCSFDIEAVKDVINEKYPGLLEEGNLSDEMLEWIGSNAMVFMLLNKNLLRAGDIQDYVNYGNIPSWVTMNNGQEFNEDLLLKCCIEAMAKLADMGQKLGYDPKEFVNRNLAEEVEKMYLAEVEKLNSPQVNYAPRMDAPNNELPFPDYIMDFLRQKYGENITFKSTATGTFETYLGSNFIGNIICGDGNVGWFYPVKSIDNNYRYTKEIYFPGDSEPIYKYEYDWSKYVNNLCTSEYNKDLLAPLFSFDSYSLGCVLQAMDKYSNSNNTLAKYKSSIMESFINILIAKNSDPSYPSWDDISWEDNIISWEDIDLFDTTHQLAQKIFDMLPEDIKANFDNINDFNIAYELFKIAPRRWARLNQNSIFQYDNGLGGVLDGIKQGGMGTCYLLSTILSAAQYSDLINLIEETFISTDDLNKTITVMLNGQPYTYTYDEILHASEFSNGNFKMRALEKAFTDYAIQMSGQIDGGNLIFILNALGLKDIPICHKQGDEIDDLINLIKNNIEFIGHFGVNSSGFTAINTQTGEEVELPSNHAYNILGADDKYIYIQNPHDSTIIWKLSIDTIKNNPSAFSYTLAQKKDVEKSIEKLKPMPKEMMYNLQNGVYLNNNGEFNWDKYYADCRNFGINPKWLNLEANTSIDSSGEWVTVITFANRLFGTRIEVHPNRSAIITVERPYITFDISTTSFGEAADLSSLSDEELFRIPNISYFINPDGSINREEFAEFASYFCDDLHFDYNVFGELAKYFIKDDGNLDKENFKKFLSNFNSYDQIVNYSYNLQSYEYLNTQNNMLAGIEALKDWVSGILSRLKNSGSIYSGTDYWGMTDVFWNPYASAQDVENAINMMRAMQNAAKQLGMTLDQYLSLSPSQREHYQGMLTTPLPIDYYLLTEHYDYIDNNYYGGGENEDNTYYSTPNQSSIISAPDWFKDLIANGNYPNMDEIQNNLIFGTASEEEGKLYDEFYKFNMWCYYNNGLTDNLSSIELYNLYTLDMTFFFMWMNTEAILLGYSPDDSFETLYEAYQKNNKFF
ncbi:hypothetical protein IJ750_05920 [bacterium]|nr:hypothetical protein [bacterium]